MKFYVLFNLPKRTREQEDKLAIKQLMSPKVNVSVIQRFYSRSIEHVMGKCLLSVR